MIKTISRNIDKILWPQRVKRGQRCDCGWWWWVQPMVNALTSASGASAGATAGTTAAASGATGAAGGVIGTGASLGTVGSAGGLVTASTPIASGVATTGGNSLLANSLATGISSIGSSKPLENAFQAAENSNKIGGFDSSMLNIFEGGGLSKGWQKAALEPSAIAEQAANEGLGLGKVAPLASEAPKNALWEGLRGIAQTAVDELTPFGSILDPKKKLSEKIGDTAVNMVKQQKEDSKKKEQPVNIDNTISMTAPNIVSTPNASSMGNQQQPLSLEAMMQIVQMVKKNKAKGSTSPIASQFPGGFY